MTIRTIASDIGYNGKYLGTVVMIAFEDGMTGDERLYSVTTSSPLEADLFMKRLINTEAEKDAKRLMSKMNIDIASL